MTTTEIRISLSKLFEQWAGVKPSEIVELPLSGSSRRYFRIKSDQSSVIGTYNKDKVENSAFFYLAEHFKKAGVNIPEVYVKNEESGVYLQQDLGETTLYKYLKEEEGVSENLLIDIYKKIINQLPVLQYKAAEGLDFSVCYPREAFDRQSIQWDLNYFKYCYLKLAGIPFHEQKLEDDFQKLIAILLEAPSNFFLFRDFQSRNIMVTNEEIYFIDFQGGRRGALQYDLASLLYESKINLSSYQRKQLLDYYIEVFSEYSFFNKQSFLKYYPYYTLIRLLQAFGAYGYRGLFEKKAFFTKSIELGLQNLSELFESNALSEEFAYLFGLVKQMQNLDSNFKAIPDSLKLTVSITSFSYKNGLPDDWTGNGGGFIFDCRALPNPGRHEQYRSQTGRDEEVIKFMSDKPEIEDFQKNVQTAIASSVKSYSKRGFKHLSVAFGCTGGQHRSVYSAEQLFSFLKLNFDVNLRLIHREQNIEEFYDKDNV